MMYKRVLVGGEFEQPKGMVNTIQGLRSKCGTLKKPFEIYATGKGAYSQEGVKSLDGTGVDMVFVGFHNHYAGKLDTRTLQQKIDTLDGYAENFIKV
jgi:hypothetical protein